jgi:hypothetical protein
MNDAPADEAAVYDEAELVELIVQQVMHQASAH